MALLNERAGSTPGMRWFACKWSITWVVVRLVKHRYSTLGNVLMGKEFKHQLPTDLLWQVCCTKAHCGLAVGPGVVHIGL